MKDDMNLSAPSRELLKAAGRIACVPCDVARASWACGGYHLTCRACEIDAVSSETIAARQTFYSALMAQAGATSARGGPQGGSAA